eukprot:COSAG01_NODE_636_length_14635_cov_18.612617_10_plen_140_part_00
MHDLFQAYLDKHDSRYTSQKRMVVTEILKTRRHFELEDFLNKLHKQKKTFSRATIYRTIKQLLEAGLIQKITTQSGKVFYEPCRDQKQHDHLICKNCGKIIEIKEDLIENYLGKFCQNIGFKSEYRSLHVFGICQSCQK